MPNESEEREPDTLVDPAPPGSIRGLTGGTAGAGEGRNDHERLGGTSNQRTETATPTSLLLGPTVVVNDRAQSDELQNCIEKALGGDGPVRGIEAIGAIGTPQAARAVGAARADDDVTSIPVLSNLASHLNAGNTHSSSLRPDDIHVLVVDDEMMSRTVVSTLLKKFKYTVTTAEDGAEAMELLKSSPPGTYHLVLTDVRMPKLNGIELLQYIRSEETLRSVPVVMMSGYDGEEVVGACEEGGAEEYLVKPVGAAKVANIWQHVLKKRGEVTMVPQTGVSEGGNEGVVLGRGSVTAMDATASNRKLMESLREQSTITSEFLKMMREKRVREFTLLKEQVMLLQEDCEAVSHLSERDDLEDEASEVGRKRKQRGGAAKHEELVDLSWLNARGLDASYFAKIHRSTPQSQQANGSFESFDPHTNDENLRDFATSLNEVSRRSSLVVESTIRSGNMANPQEMVCYADFDADDSHFATVSVSRSVKVFDYASIVESPESLQFPIWQATTRSKLSSVSWNSYLRSHLITSDYEGAIQLWDVASGMKTELSEFVEHGKRAWSIDFSRMDPMQFASASDDATVKIWSLQETSSSVSTLKLPANACSVHYHPRNATMLSVACANHACYVFDVRKADKPLALLGGATRAVSYIKHFSPDASCTLVFGASTDNAIRSWDISDVSETGVLQSNPQETYTGHANERNFVGLSVNNEGYVATGSEDNSVVVYYYKFPFAVCRYDLGRRGVEEGGAGEGVGGSKAFTSSVCWARGGGSLLVGNSEGCLSLLRLK